MMKKKKIPALIVPAFMSIPVFAWDGIVSGTVFGIDGTSAGNLPFRVFLTGTPAMCGNANAWAYLNDADGNYKVNAALILSAKVQGSTVIVYSNRDGAGYCQIGYVQVR